MKKKLVSIILLTLLSTTIMSCGTTSNETSDFDKKIQQMQGNDTTTSEDIQNNIIDYSNVTAEDLENVESPKAKTISTTEAFSILEEKFGKDGSSYEGYVIGYIYNGQANIYGVDYYDYSMTLLSQDGSTYYYVDIVVALDGSDAKIMKQDEFEGYVFLDKLPTIGDTSASTDAGLSNESQDQATSISVEEEVIENTIENEETSESTSNILEGFSFEKNK